jgi:2-polyprenyl-6-methoxyphenol hydroxylase-like FAD-dependent oxidoreductase
MDICDVLVVGAGPTGLTLAARLHEFGASVRIVDQTLDPVHESRALAVQPRTLEVLRSLGLAAELVHRGNPSVCLRLHAGSRVASAQLFDVGLEDAAFPFLLFVSQAETEAVLGEHLAARGIEIERGMTFERFDSNGDALSCTMRSGDGRYRKPQARYLAGCDGAHSVVRDSAGIAFRGGRYPQTFLLADLDVDGLELDTVHTYLTDRGPLFFFPLRRPAPWRLITMRPPALDAASAPADHSVSSTPVSLDELQALADRATGRQLRLGDPVWATAFRLHHRHAFSYRSGRVFLAGEAAHIHSPAGARGMNTGIQDAANLGWKLGLVVRGHAPDDLLDSYDAERRPVGESVLRFHRPGLHRRPADSWGEPDLAALAERHGALLTVVRLDRRPGPGILCSEAAMARFHVSGVAHFVVRPDDHVGYRADNNDLGGLSATSPAGSSRHLEAGATAGAPPGACRSRRR